MALISRYLYTDNLQKSTVIKCTKIHISQITPSQGRSYVYIESVSITAENYNVAWNNLVSSFNNKKIIQKQIKPIHELPDNRKEIHSSYAK